MLNRAKGLLTRYMPGYIGSLVYMLQSVEYQAGPYLKWYRRTTNFRTVAKRRQLVKTRAANLLLVALTAGILAQLAVGLILIIWNYNQPSLIWSVLGFVMILSYPFVWAWLLVVPLVLGRWLIVRPKQAKLIAASEPIFRDHPGLTIAIAGSYGKTTMKELLLTVLQQGKQVAATPANKNVAVSHAYFARKLTGQEDILLIEYGEGRPGDIAKFAQITHPDIGIITGLAPAHLDQYPNLQAAGEDIFSLSQYVKPADLYVNADSSAVQVFLQPDFQTYSTQQVLGWQIADIKVDFNSTSFVMTKDNQQLQLSSQLMGRHQVGPLALAAALALKLGLTAEQVRAGVAATAPFEHRMQPRQLHGAWIIDDTYNGNIDGLKAGLQLLHELPGKRKIYVTPGLVDQGVETAVVHKELGQAIAESSPDKVVLMQNSATPYIQAGLQAANYGGQVEVESEPLNFYTNLDHLVAAGDVVLMQNDWTDNYL